MKLVKNILDGKGNEIWSVASDNSVLDAIKMMAEKRVGALLVMDDDNLSGVISERDYARKVILMGRSSEQTPVGEIMTKEVICAHPDHTVDECMSLMTEHRIRHLPITRNEKVVGVLSIGDLVKAKIDEQQYTIEQLQSYITS